MIEAIKELHSDGKPTYILCNGSEMNAISGVDYFPKDHTFEWTKKDGWVDKTSGVKIVGGKIDDRP